MSKTINITAGIPGILNLQIYRDRDFSWTILFSDKLTGNPLDLNGWTGKAEIRSGKDHPVAPAPDNLLETFTVNVFGDQGMVVLTLTDVETAAIDLEPGEVAFWALVLTDGSGNRWPYLEGQIDIFETVTRA